MGYERHNRKVIIQGWQIAIGLGAVAAFGAAALLTLAIGQRLNPRGDATPDSQTMTGNAAQTGTEPGPTAVIGPASTGVAGQVIHTVQPGETLIGIAGQYGISPDVVESANHLKNPGMIFPGQQLIIPDTQILTPVMPLGTLPPTPSATLASGDAVNLSVLSGWPRSIADGTSQQLEANYPVAVARPRFTLHYQPGTYPDKYLDEVIHRVEQALTNVEARLQVHLQGTFDVYAAGTLFVGNDAHLRGQSRSRDRRLFFLADGTGTPAENDYVVTHELTHLVAWNTWGAPSSTMLSEGLATYDGKPELEAGGFIPYDQLCLAIVTAGQLPPLAAMDRDASYFQGHIEDRFNYFGSACFIDYLIKTYGLGSMTSLYHSSDYLALYGKSLGDLDQEWRASLEARKAELTLNTAALISFNKEVTAAYDTIFKNYDNTGSMHQAYLAIDRARIALWQADYPSTRRWLDQVYQLTGFRPQVGTAAPPE